MTKEELKGYLESAIKDGNYLSAYMTLKKESREENVLTEQDVIDFTGRIVVKVVDDLGRLNKRENRERIMFLRALLIWIFKDVPGLSAVYREQLRMQTGQVNRLWDVLKSLNIRGLEGVTGNEDVVVDEVEETVDNIRQNLEDAAESIRTGEVNEQVRDLFTLAESGVRQGLKQMNDVLRSLNQERRE